MKLFGQSLDYIDNQSLLFDFPIALTKKLFGHPLRTIIVLLIFYIACLFHTVHHLL